MRPTSMVVPDAKDVTVLVNTRARARAYLRQLPGPAWSMALWLAVGMISRALQGAVDPVPPQDWLPQILFQGMCLVAILVWPRTRRNWLPLVLLLCQVLIAYSLMLGAATTAGQLGHSIMLVVAVIYSALWWRGWLAFATAAVGSALYAHAASRLGTVEELDDVWLSLTIGLFGVALGFRILAAQTREQVWRDALTGVLNRTALDQYLELEGRGGRSTTPRALVLIDLDGFKAVNDRHGHAAGDALLLSCVGAWQAELRSDDRLFRTGGDEFLVIAPKSEPADAERIAQRLRAVSPSPVSIGLSQWPERGDFDAALRVADERMYEEKRSRQRRLNP